MLITIRDLSVHVNVKLSMSLFNVMGVRKMSLARNVLGLTNLLSSLETINMNTTLKYPMVTFKNLLPTISRL